MFDKYFDEINIGEKWVSRARTITETDIVMFAALSGDWYPLHTDKEYAKNTQYKERIAHGLLILSISSGLWKLKPDVIIAFYGIDKLRFTAPVYINDTIHVVAEVLDKKIKNNNSGTITFKENVINQLNKPVLYLEAKILFKRHIEDI